MPANVKERKRKIERINPITDYIVKSNTEDLHFKETLSDELLADIEKKKKKLYKNLSAMTTEQRMKEYEEVEELVTLYKKQFDPEASLQDKRVANRSSLELLERFNPLFTKYLILIKTSKINFLDAEMKRFVKMFVGDESLKKSLRRQRQTARFRHPILQRFNFVRETYGKLSEEDIMTDLRTLFLVLAKRYKPMGRNFCAYVYNAYSFEVARHIKKYINNPANIKYRTVEYEDFMTTTAEDAVESCLEDRIYENNMGIPDMTWIAGRTCSDEFQSLSNLERKLLLKYYLEDYNDRQIAEEFHMHINSVNLKRRKAIKKLAIALGIPEDTIKRSRNSGKKALLYTKLQK